MFSPEDRERLKEELIARARSGAQVVAAALLGSSSTGAEDRWSDIDLALCITPGAIEQTTEDWTSHMYDDCGAVHHLDVRWNTTLYRVFLLGSSLQVDISFWSSREFIAAGPEFRLLFGQAPAQRAPDPQPTEAIVGETWLHLLHARSALARGRRWQADYMIAGARDRVLSLACQRHHLRTDHARGVDELPGTLLADYAAMIPASSQDAALQSALEATTTALIHETRQTDPTLANRLTATLNVIATGDLTAN